MARVSAYFGFDLLVTFPYYQGGHAGQPIQNPLATERTPSLCIYSGDFVNHPSADVVPNRANTTAWPFTPRFSLALTAR